MGNGGSTTDYFYFLLKILLAAAASRGSVRDYFLLKVLLAAAASYEALRSLMELYGALWSLMEPDEALWIPMKPYEAIWRPSRGSMTEYFLFLFSSQRAGQAHRSSRRGYSKNPLLDYFPSGVYFWQREMACTLGERETLWCWSTGLCCIFSWFEVPLYQKLVDPSWSPEKYQDYVQPAASEFEADAQELQRKEEGLSDWPHSRIAILYVAC